LFPQKHGHYHCEQFDDFDQQLCRVIGIRHRYFRQYGAEHRHLHCSCAHLHRAYCNLFGIFSVIFSRYHSGGYGSLQHRSLITDAMASNTEPP
jgi:hypothetical protein